ncbi:MAG: S-layer homology domain-containing protein [Ruminococcaceae bacterium]|nr:S-layer homology domain-containing protein [Oscillospiraceae bacterium]
MKNLKKVLALVLACVMVFGTVAVAGSVYPDVADDAIYAESVKTLSALGIIKGDENGNFNPDNTVTRAEMAKILCTMLGTGEIAQANTIFSDVPSSHWASGYVNYAQQYGAIAGYGDGTFGPEDPVTYEQVVKLIMVALGYTTKAEENGGYPTGYLYVAADAEVTDRAVGNGPEPAPRSTVAILANNAMNTPVMERTTYGTSALWEVLDGGSYNGIYGATSREFKTLLTSKHKAYKVEGKVTNSYKGKTSLKDGYVDTTITDNMKIGVKNVLGASGTAAPWTLNNINAAGTDAADYVGYESYLYYQVDAYGDVNLICVSPKSSRNKSIAIDNIGNIYNSADDAGIRAADKPSIVYGTDESGSTIVAKYVFSYWNDRDTENRITTVDLDANATVYTNNGAAVQLASIILASEGTQSDLTTDPTKFDADDVVAFVPSKGSVTLVDTDNDGDYDLIKVVSIDTVIVDTINAKSNRINFKVDGKNVAATKLILSADAFTNLKEYSITIDGAAADVADLKEYDVLSIVTNSWVDPTYFYIDVTRNVIEGTVTAKKTTGTNPYVVIGGEKYGVANVSGISLSSINLEDEGKFYLDDAGKIVLKDTTSVLSGDYAYLYSTGSGNFAGETYVRMFTKDGADVTYRLADKVEINGVQAQNANYVFTDSDLNKMFVAPTATPYASPVAATVGDLFNTASTATPAVATTDALTASNLVKALVDGIDAASRLGYDLKADLTTAAPVGNSVAKFVTYKADSNGNITELNLVSNWAGQDQFGYLGTPGSVEWKEALAKFDGSVSLPDNAVVFFAKPGDSIADYAVKTVADLVDGTTYTPYFFTNTEDGPAAVLMLMSTASIDTKASFAIFAGYSDTTVDGDAAYSISYWKDGALVEAPLTAIKSDLTVATEYGTPLSIGALNVGDAFIYSETDKGTVDKIEVVFTAGSAPAVTLAPSAALDTTLSSLITIATPVPSIQPDFEFYGNAGNTADNELIYGIVAKTKSIADGVRLTIADETGSIATAETVNVPSTAKVIYLNTSISNDEKKIAEAVVTDIAASNVVTTTAGDIDFASVDFEINDLNYVFVRVYKDVVTEVIFVRYASDI